MNCILPWCFRIEFQKVRCRVINIQGPNPLPAPAAFENDIMAKYVNFTFDCLGDDCTCTLGQPSAWQKVMIAKQAEPYTLNGVQYTIDYSLRFEVRIKWGTCDHKKKGAGEGSGSHGSHKKAGKKKRRR